jgi:3-oxoacyl-[acyl-carrier protein] reductase
MSTPVPAANQQPHIAVITGGTLGIGEHITKQLLAAGWHVHVLARHASSFPLADGQHCFVYDVDVRDAAALSVVADAIYGRLGSTPIDALIACAGVGYPTPLATLTGEQYADLFDTNVHGTIFTVKLFAPYLYDGRAVIAVVSSIAGRRGYADWSVYCAAKHALEGFVASIRDELRPRRIRVTSIQPGSVDTPSYDHLAPEEKTEFMAPATVAALVVHTLTLPAQAVVETLFVNNAVGDM